jgi:uncharacterized flavoprotein (TIGR03862 family)
MADIDALVIGAGPAGLMAAEVLSAAGKRVLVADAKPSPARKFLMAGKSGLNLTRNEPFDQFLTRYADAPLGDILAAFDSQAVMAWARGLGQEIFTGSTGLVFPRAMKASPLLRAWLSRLQIQGVVLNRRWRWAGFVGATGTDCRFDTPEGPKTLTAPITILALGGASWARLGSDAAWQPYLTARGVEITPFQPSNAGLVVQWSDHMAAQFGAPLKNIALQAGRLASRGEAVISAHGLEGGGIYRLSPALRDGAALTLDLLPDLSVEPITQKLERPRGKSTRTAHLRKTLKLDAAKLALLMEFARPLPEARALAEKIKALPIAHAGLRPIDEAISTAGGVSWASLDQGLQLRAIPGVYCTGEMVDWDAPTGGYLLTACFAMGRHAALNALTASPAG